MSTNSFSTLKIAPAPISSLSSHWSPTQLFNFIQTLLLFIHSRAPFIIQPRSLCWKSPIPGTTLSLNETCPNSKLPSRHLWCRKPFLTLPSHSDCSHFWTLQLIINLLCSPHPQKDLKILESKGSAFLIAQHSDLKHFPAHIASNQYIYWLMKLKAHTFNYGYF